MLLRRHIIRSTASLKVAFVAGHQIRVGSTDAGNDAGDKASSKEDSAASEKVQDSKNTSYANEPIETAPFPASTAHSTSSHSSSHHDAAATEETGNAHGEGKGTCDRDTAALDAAVKEGDKAVTEAAPEPVRWIQSAYEDPEDLPIVDERGQYIVTRVKWPTGEVAYTTPPPVDDKLAPRFGYNVVQVKKHVSWWKYNQKYPRLSFAYLNIQVIFLLGLAWLTGFLTTEYRNATEAMKKPGAMVGEHRGRGPVTDKKQKVSLSSQDMSAMIDKAQNNWLDGSAEANYIGSKDYVMRQIPRPKEFSADDFRKR